MPLFPKQFYIKIRAWDYTNKKMIYDPEFVWEAGYKKLKGFAFTQWIGHLDDSPEQKMIYHGDICDIEVLNEFGSISKYEAIVGYNMEKAGYSYDIINSNTPLAGTILRAYVKTNIYEKPNDNTKEPSKTD